MGLRVRAIQPINLSPFSRLEELHHPGPAYLLGGSRWSVEARVFRDPGSHWPPEPAARQHWRVGLIQNLVSDDIQISYFNQRTIHVWLRGQPLLDAPSEGHPFYTPQPMDVRRQWFLLDGALQQFQTSVRSWDGIPFGGGDGPTSDHPLFLDMRDEPLTPVLQYFQGHSHGNLLDTVRHRMTFRLFVTALPETENPQLLRNHHILAYSDLFTVGYDFRTPDAIEPSTREITVPWRSVLSRHQQHGTPPLVVTIPLANTAVRQAYEGHGFLPTD